MKMKSNSFSRRGLLMGAAALAATRLKAADYPETLAVNEDVPGAAGPPPYVYLGCYTGGANARGISVFHYDPATNAMTLISIVAPVASPSFIVLDATKKFLYSGNESGAGSASALDRKSTRPELQSHSFI